MLPLIWAVISRLFTKYCEDRGTPTWDSTTNMLRETTDVAKHDEKEHYEELWVQIKDFPQYEVSNYGRVVNIANDRDLTARKGRDGLLYVELRNGNRNQKRHYVHELVAEAFFQQYGPGVQVIHINQDALHDNSVLNLSLRSLLL